MKFCRGSEDAFTGLEAAIVLIAFIVVAAVFAYVILGAGFFTTQKSQETVYKSVEQATSNIQIIGQVYGINDGAGANRINKIQFTIGLAAGSPDLDLTKMSIVFSTPASAVQTYTLASDTTPTASKFVAERETALGTRVTSLTQDAHVQITFITGDGSGAQLPVGPGTKMTFEIRPATGAPIPFTKNTPGALTSVTNILY